MKPQTKTIIVITTSISGRRHFIKGPVSVKPDTGKWMINYTEKVKDEAREFDTIDQARVFISNIHNPCDRVFEVAEETVTFNSLKELRAYERIQ